MFIMHLRQKIVNPFIVGFVWYGIPALRRRTEPNYPRQVHVSIETAIQCPTARGRVPRLFGLFQALYSLLCTVL